MPVPEKVDCSFEVVTEWRKTNGKFRKRGCSHCKHIATCSNHQRQVMDKTSRRMNSFLRPKDGNNEVNLRIKDNEKCSAGKKDYSNKSRYMKLIRLGALDTLGLVDTFKSDGDILQLVANYLSATYKQDTLLNGLILLQPIHGTRLQGNEMKRTSLFKRILGKGAYSRVIIATTMWSMLRNVGHGNQQTQERKERDDVRGDMEACGAQIVRHDDNQNLALNIIRMVFDFPNPKPLQIQTELVHTNGRVALTSAGRQLDEDLGELVACLRREIESLRLDRETAQAEIQDMQERLRDIEAQKSSLGGAIAQGFFELVNTVVNRECIIL